MKKSAIVAIIVAAILLVAGTALFLAGFAMMNFNFKGMTDVKYTTQTHKITEDFSSISIDISVSDVAFMLSDNGETRVECYENDKHIHTVAVNDGVLCIGEQKSFNVFNFINIDFDKPRVTLYLTRTQFDSLHINSDTSLIAVPAQFSFNACNIQNRTGDVSFNATSNSLSIKATTGRIMVSDIAPTGDVHLQANTGHVTLRSAQIDGQLFIHTTTGRIHLEDVDCGRIDLESSTGDKTILRLNCASLTSESSTGRSSFTDVIAKGKISIEADTGDVKLERCDAAELSIETDTGDVSGSLLSEKIFYAETDTGRVRVPHTTTGGKCEVKTDTGNITFTVEK